MVQGKGLWLGLGVFRLGLSFRVRVDGYVLVFMLRVRLMV